MCFKMLGKGSRGMASSTHRRCRGEGSKGNNGRDAGADELQGDSHKSILHSLQAADTTIRPRLHECSVLPAKFDSTNEGSLDVHLTKI